MQKWVAEFSFEALQFTGRPVLTQFPGDQDIYQETGKHVQQRQRLDLPADVNGLSQAPNDTPCRILLDIPPSTGQGSPCATTDTRHRVADESNHTDPRSPASLGQTP